MSKEYSSHVLSGSITGNGEPYRTGVALLNLFGSVVAYTLSVFDGSGALIAQVTDSLGPHEKVSRFLSHPVPGPGFFTQPLSLGSGHIEVSSDRGVLGLELFFTEDFSQLAGVAAQSPTP